MVEFGEKLIIASASQNLDTKSERVVHRLIPILVAENLTRVSEYESGKPRHRVDLWNCVGMRMDKSFINQNVYTSRRDFSSALLADKYILLEELGIPSQGRAIIRDDDESTKTWLEQKVKELLSLHAIYIDSVGVNICNSCGYLQSIDYSNINSCTVCNGGSFHKEKRDVLMVDIPKDRNSLIKDRIVHPKNTKHIRSFFDQLPPKMMISKVREYGLPLDSIGLPGYVLDPKIGVALMPELVAEKYGLSELTQVQGAAVATNAIPYTSILTSGFHHTYVLLPKIPVTTLEQARNIGISFISRYLPFVLMTHRGDITPVQLKTAQEEYARVTWKIDSILYMLQPKSTQSVNLTPEDHQALADVVRDFSEYRIRTGQEKLSKFFKSQGRRYIQELKDSGYYLNPTDIDTIEDIIKLFYR